MERIKKNPAHPSTRPSDTPPTASCKKSKITLKVEISAIPASITRNADKDYDRHTVIEQDSPRNLADDSESLPFKNA